LMRNPSLMKGFLLDLGKENQSEKQVLHSILFHINIL